MLSWEAFESALAGVLRDLSARSYLIVSSSPESVYVQFAQGADVLQAEASGDSASPPVPPLSVEAVDALVGAGWTQPDFGRGGNPNWTWMLETPTLSSEYRLLAGACVLALQLRGVPGPESLSYRAWREAERPKQDALYYPGDLDSGDPELVLSALGISVSAA